MRRKALRYSIYYFALSTITTCVLCAVGPKVLSLQTPFAWQNTIVQLPVSCIYGIFAEKASLLAPEGVIASRIARAILGFLLLNSFLFLVVCFFAFYLSIFRFLLVWNSIAASLSAGVFVSMLRSLEQSSPRVRIAIAGFCYLCTLSTTIWLSGLIS